MTRSEVARRLGKSLATVRRLEGVLLHPALDERGVHQFDRDEVDCLARRMRRGDVDLAREMRPATSRLFVPCGEPDLECEQCSALHARVRSLCADLEAAHSRHQRELAALKERQAQYLAEREAEADALATQLADLLDALEN